MRDRIRNRRGVALILALLVLTILIVLIAEMTVSSTHNRTISENFLYDLQNSFAAQSGAVRARLYLEADLETGPNEDHLHEKWAVPIQFDCGSGKVTVRIEDEDRRINLSDLVKPNGEVNSVVKEQLTNLVRVLAHPGDVVARIIDYMDKDAKGEYESGAKNDYLYNAEELLRIEGIPKEVCLGGTVDYVEKKGILPFVTVWPKSGATSAPSPPQPQPPPQPGLGQPPPQPAVPSAGRTLNINTAPLEVIVALSSKMTLAMAQEIVTYREQQDQQGNRTIYKTIDDVKKTGLEDSVFNEIKSQIGVRSSTFAIKSRSMVGNLERGWVTIVSRSAAPPAGGTGQPLASGGAPSGAAAQSGPIEVLSSYRINDFLTVKPPESEESGKSR